MDKAATASGYLMKPEHLKLLGLSQAELDGAKANQRIVWLAQGAVGLLALIAVLPLNSILSGPLVDLAANILTILTLIGSGVALLFTWRVRSRRNVAERARRALTLMRALDWHISGQEWADLINGFHVTAEQGERRQRPDFYDSAGPYGDKALADIIEESAFWTKNLYGYSAEEFFWVAIIAVALLFVILLLAPQLAPLIPSVLVSRLTGTALTAIITLDIWGMALAFRWAADELARIDLRLQKVIAQGYPQPDYFTFLATTILPWRVHRSCATECLRNTSRNSTRLGDSAALTTQQQGVIDWNG